MAESKSTRRTTGQRLYEQVTVLERQITDLMDDIPHQTLGRQADTCALFREVIENLRDAVLALKDVKRRELARYNQWEEARP
jgi:hypothetical protein